jgi:hypothetical protein
VSSAIAGRPRSSTAPGVAQAPPLTSASADRGIRRLRLDSLPGTSKRAVRVLSHTTASPGASRTVSPLVRMTS